jgi:lipoprotein-anchoring transpeptidase ErfK/SrfK
VRRTGLAFLFVAGFALAGGLSAGVVAGTTTTATGTTATTTGATTTVPTTTTTTTGTTTTEPTPNVLPPAVTIGGVPVGGLIPSAAYVAVRAAFAKPIVLVLGRREYEVPPARVGAIAYVRNAVNRARTAAPGSAVRLKIVVRRGVARSYVARLARRFDRAAIDSRLLLRDLRPWVTPGQPGRAVDRSASVAAIARALEAGRRRPIRLVAKKVSPLLTRETFGPVIVIRRGSNRLNVYRGMRPWRTFGVATGQAVYPTPLGRFSIVVKWRNPWWYPPNSGWAKGLNPIPPGPGNPLGTRWMGLSVSGVGIHGTPDDASIGYSASHGCIRMHIRDAEWMFEHVDIGTPVFIVSA